MADPFISRKNILLFSVMIIVTGIMAYLGVLFFMIRYERETARKKAESSSRIYSFPSMVISLFDRAGMAQVRLSGHLKIQVSLKLKNKAVEDAVNSMTIQLTDIINQILTGKQVSDVYDEKPDLLEMKKKKLQDEICTALNRALNGNAVLSIYFSEYFVH